ncbi:hypothetical protein P8C59_007602 [Phyllachora maydis]|uniref:Uncharacterized protein n=1 Tax=Phyllachora maydis TaxID=1825666 RepID=A0AAD9I8V2_9PEZI|nr:hypothetical protein P8C59_007602 [Phyllachora maydis]
MYIMLLTRYLNSTKDYSICFSYNENTVADLGPKLNNSSNTTTKPSRDFYSKEGPRSLTTTSTDSRNGKGSSRTSIINSSLVPIGFSDSDFTGDKATSKSTYGYLYKLAGGPISWKTKRATTIALSTLEAGTDGLTETIREVQTKHTLLKFRYVREQVKAKIVTIMYLNTKCTAVAAPAKAADAAAAEPTKPTNTATAEPAKAADAAAIPAAAAKAAAAEPTSAGTAAAAVINDINDAISPIVFSILYPLSTCVALYTKAKAKAKEEEKEEEEEEEEEKEEDKEVVEEEKDIEGRGKEDKALA